MRNSCDMCSGEGCAECDFTGNLITDDELLADSFSFLDEDGQAIGEYKDEEDDGEEGIFSEEYDDEYEREMDRDFGIDGWGED